MRFFDQSRGKNYGVHHFIASHSGTLVDVLASTLGMGKETSDFLLNIGAVYLNERRLSPFQTEIKNGDYLRVHSQPRRFQENLLDWPSSLIFENRDFIVVNKPSGLPVHPTVDNIQENLQRLFSEKINTEILVTHRLDIPTAGLIVFAKTKEFQKIFNTYLRNRKIRKFYRCLVQNNYEGSLILKHYMKPSPRAPKQLSKELVKDWAPCELHIQGVEPTKEGNFILNIDLITGRTHQIRSQLSYEGYPIIGDKLYGSRVPFGRGNFEQIALQAYFLSFPDYSFQLSSTTF